MNQLQFQRKIEELQSEINELRKLNEIFTHSSLGVQNDTLRDTIHDLEVENHYIKTSFEDLKKRIDEMKDALNEIERIASANS